jgi:hypothetical protein
MGIEEQQMHQRGSVCKPEETPQQLRDELNPGSLKEPRQGVQGLRQLGVTPQIGHPSPLSRSPPKKRCRGLTELRVTLLFPVLIGRVTLSGSHSTSRFKYSLEGKRGSDDRFRVISKSTVHPPLLSSCSESQSEVELHGAFVVSCSSAWYFATLSTFSRQWRPTFSLVSSDIPPIRLSYPPGGSGFDVVALFYV